MKSNAGLFLVLVIGFFSGVVADRLWFDPLIEKDKEAKGGQVSQPSRLGSPTESLVDDADRYIQLMQRGDDPYESDPETRKNVVGYISRKVQRLIDNHKRGSEVDILPYVERVLECGAVTRDDLGITDEKLKQLERGLLITQARICTRCLRSNYVGSDGPRWLRQLDALLAKGITFKEANTSESEVKTFRLKVREMEDRWKRRAAPEHKGIGTSNFGDFFMRMELLKRLLDEQGRKQERSPEI